LRRPQAAIKKRFGVELAERTVGTVLNKLGFRRPVAAALSSAQGCGGPGGI